MAVRIAALLPAAVTAALAQCSMCRTAVAAQPGAGNTMNAAILILLIPAVGLFSGVFLLAFHSQGAAGSDEDEEGCGKASAAGSDEDEEGCGKASS